LACRKNACVKQGKGPGDPVPPSPLLPSGEILVFWIAFYLKSSKLYNMENAESVISETLDYKIFPGYSFYQNHGFFLLLEQKFAMNVLM
jgi:hypothetical protein